MFEYIEPKASESAGDKVAFLVQNEPAEKSALTDRESSGPPKSGIESAVKDYERFREKAIGEAPDAEASAEDVQSALRQVSENLVLKMDLAFQLQANGLSFQGEKHINDAIEIADRFPTGYLRREGKLMREFAGTLDDPASKEYFLKEAKFNDSLADMPIEARRNGVAFYLGLTGTIEEKAGKDLPSVTIDYGEKRGFNPDKAYDLALELKEKIVSEHGEEALKNDAYTNINGLRSSSVESKQDLNLFSVVESMTGRSFDIGGKANVSDFVDGAFSVFDNVDENKDGLLDSGELEAAASDKSLPSKSRQILSAMDKGSGNLSRIHNDEWGFDTSMSRQDLVGFIDVQRRSTRNLEKMSAARKKVLFGHDPQFDKIDSTGWMDAEPGYLDKNELDNYMKSTRMTNEERQSFQYLVSNSGPFHLYDYGPKRSDFVFPMDPRVAELHRNLWTAYMEEKGD